MLHPKFLIVTLLAVQLISLTNIASGQGCSDAGFCTINNFKPDNIDTASSVTSNQVRLGLSYGSADHSITVAGEYLEYNRKINDQWGIDAKLTALSQSGNGISVFGLSDIFLNASFSANKKLKLIAGLKIPLTDGNKMKDNLPLPMDYQSSLGTFDLIAGVSCEVQKLQFIIALQQPLTQNENKFMAEIYPASSELREFQSTNLFQRSGDVLLRASYLINAGEKFKITPSLLPIYHLMNDKFTDITNSEKEITGSQGLTLNGNLYFDYQLTGTATLQLNAGAPFIVRDARPDGLTRHFVMNLEYRIKF